jgi:hypothetical protein
MLGAVRVDAEDLVAARRCAAEANASARLACYDAAFAVAPPAPAAQFGDNNNLQQKRTPKVADVPKALQLTITRAQALPQGLYRLTLDNGQVWETRQAEWTLDFKTDAIVTISRLPLGSYQISMKGNPHAVGAKRLQ